MLKPVIFQLFLLSVLARFLFAPNGKAASGSYEVKQLLLIVFDKYPKEKAVGAE